MMATKKVTKKAATKKPAAKKAATKKPAATKTVAKKAVAKKTAPPQPASVGLLLCVLHHSYDRMIALQHFNGWRGKPY